MKRKVIERHKQGAGRRRTQEETGALVTGALVFLLFISAILSPSVAYAGAKACKRRQVPSDDIHIAYGVPCQPEFAIENCGDATGVFYYKILKNGSECASVWNEWLDPGDWSSTIKCNFTMGTSNVTITFQATHAENGDWVDDPLDYEDTVTYIESVPPATPTGLTATGHNGYVTLEWDANTESDFDHYKVYRIDPYYCFDFVTGTSMNVSGTNGTEYCFQVSAVDVNGNESPKCSSKCATPHGTPKACKRRQVPSDDVHIAPGVACEPEFAVENCGNVAGDIYFEILKNGAVCNSKTENLDVDGWSSTITCNFTMGTSNVTIKFRAKRSGASSWDYEDTVTYIASVPKACKRRQVPSDDVHIAPGVACEPEFAVENCGNVAGDIYFEILKNGAVCNSKTENLDVDGWSSTITCNFTMGTSNVTIKFRAKRSGASSWDYEDTVTYIESVPPATPTGLTATGHNGYVTLEWDANTESDFDHYKVYRIDPYYCFDFVTGTSMNVSGTNGTEYCFQVSAVDVNGNESPKCSSKCATPEAIADFDFDCGTTGCYIEYDGTKAYKGNEDNPLRAPSGVTCTAHMKVKNNGNISGKPLFRVWDETHWKQLAQKKVTYSVSVGSTAEEDITFTAPSEDTAIRFYVYWDKGGGEYREQDDYGLFYITPAVPDFGFDCSGAACYIKYTDEHGSPHYYYQDNTLEIPTEIEVEAQVRIVNNGKAPGEFYFNVAAIYEDGSPVEWLGNGRIDTLASEDSTLLSPMFTFSTPSKDADLYFEVCWHDGDEYKDWKLWGPFHYKVPMPPAPTGLKPGTDDPDNPEVIWWEKNCLEGYKFEWDDSPPEYNVDLYNLQIYRESDGAYISGVTIGDDEPLASEWIVPENTVLDEYGGVYRWYCWAHNKYGWSEQAGPKYFGFIYINKITGLTPGTTDPDNPEKIYTKTPLLDWDDNSKVSKYSLTVIEYPYEVGDEFNIDKDNLTTSEYQVTEADGLEYGKEYEWCVFPTAGSALGSDKMYFKIFAPPHFDFSCNYNHDETNYCVISTEVDGGGTRWYADDPSTTDVDESTPIVVDPDTKLYVNVSINNTGGDKGEYFFGLAAFYEDGTNEWLVTKSNTLEAGHTSSFSITFNTPIKKATLNYQVFWHYGDEYELHDIYGDFYYRIPNVELKFACGEGDKECFIEYGGVKTYRDGTFTAPAGEENACTANFVVKNTGDTEGDVCCQVLARYKDNTTEQLAWYCPESPINPIKPIGEVVEKETPNDPLFSQQWALDKISLPGAWTLCSETDEEVVIAVIDSGVDYTHPDLAANIWVNTDEIPDNGIDDDGNGYIDDIRGWNFYNESGEQDNDPMDKDGHGTQVSSIISAITNNTKDIAGMSYYNKLKIMPLRVTGYAGYSEWSAAIRYAADNGARIINMSLSSSIDVMFLKEAIIDAYNKGCLIVVAAGNADSVPENWDLANLDEVLAVSATDRNDKKCDFSNYGSVIDVSAPGEDIYMLSLGSNVTDKGTSLSCAFVSGLAGLIISQHPDWTRDQVINQILSTADPIDHLNPGYEGKLGAGRINAYRALGGGSTQISFDFNAPSKEASVEFHIYWHKSETEDVPQHYFGPFAYKPLVFWSKQDFIDEIGSYGIRVPIEDLPDGEQESGWYDLNSDDTIAAYKSDCFGKPLEIYINLSAENPPTNTDSIKFVYDGVTYDYGSSGGEKIIPESCAKKAATELMEGKAEASITLKDKATGSEIRGKNGKVRLTNTEFAYDETKNAEPTATFSVVFGDYTATGSADGYLSTTRTLTIDEPIENFVLELETRPTGVYDLRWAAEPDGASISETKDGDEVYMCANVVGLDGEKARFEVYEWDMRLPIWDPRYLIPIPNVNEISFEEYEGPVATVTATVDEQTGKVSAKWKADWIEDGWFGGYNPPEYVFKLFISEYSAESDELTLSDKKSKFIDQAYWSSTADGSSKISTAADGDKVYMYVQARYFKVGDEVVFNIKEKDPAFYDDIETKTYTLTADDFETEDLAKFSLDWTAKWVDDIPSNPPEIVFIVTIDNISKESNELSIPNKVEDTYIDVEDKTVVSGGTVTLKCLLYKWLGFLKDGINGQPIHWYIDKNQNGTFEASEELTPATTTEGTWPGEGWASKDFTATGLDIGDYQIKCVFTGADGYRESVGFGWLTVTDKDEGYAAEIVSVEPSLFDIGKKTKVVVTVKNIGKKADLMIDPESSGDWVVDDHAVDLNPYDDWKTINGVGQGETVTFDYWITPPFHADTGEITWRLYADIQWPLDNILLDTFTQKVEAEPVEIPPAPELESPEDGATVSKPFDLEWHDLPLFYVDKYEVQLYQRYPDDWKPTTTGDGIAGVTITGPPEAHSGKNALKSHITSSGSVTWELKDKYIEIKPETEYTISFWTKSADGYSGGAEVILSFYKTKWMVGLTPVVIGKEKLAGEDESFGVTAGTNWHEITATFTSPACPETSRPLYIGDIRLEFNSTGTVWLDDLTIVEGKDIEINKAPYFPEGSIVAPQDPVVVNKVYFTWYAVDDDGTIAGYYYALKGKEKDGDVFDDSTYWPPETGTITTATSKEYTLEDGTYTFLLRAKDNDGALSELFQRTFTINTVEPPEGKDSANLVIAYIDEATAAFEDSTYWVRLAPPPPSPNSTQPEWDESENHTLPTTGIPSPSWSAKIRLIDGAGIFELPNQATTGVSGSSSPGIDKMISLDPEEFYRMSVWVKKKYDCEAKIYMKLEFEDDLDNDLGTRVLPIPDGDSDWTKYTLAFKTPALPAERTLYVKSLLLRVEEGGGTVWFDDVSIVKFKYKEDGVTLDEDITEPTTAITSGPSGTINSTEATFRFSGTSSAGISGYIYSLDKQIDKNLEDYYPITASNEVTFTNLSSGSHTFYVATLDEKGFVGSVDDRSFEVNLPPEVEIQSGPSGITASSNPSFSWKGEDEDSDTLTYSYRLQGELTDTGWVDTTSTTVNFTGLSGKYGFSVKAKDKQGNESLVVSRTFDVDSPPHIDSSTPTLKTPTVNEGDTLVFTAEASDSDGEVISYTWTVDGEIRSITDYFEYTPDNSEVGEREVVLTVSDGRLSATETWTVTVNDTNNPPEIIWWSPVESPVAVEIKE